MRRTKVTRGGGGGRRRGGAAPTVVEAVVRKEAGAIAPVVMGQVVPRPAGLDQLSPELWAEVELQLGARPAAVPQVVVVVVNQAAPPPALPPELAETLRDIRNYMHRDARLARVMDEISVELQVARRERGEEISRWERGSTTAEDVRARRNVDEDPEIVERARELARRARVG